MQLTKHFKGQDAERVYLFIDMFVFKQVRLTKTRHVCLRIR